MIICQDSRLPAFGLFLCLSILGTVSEVRGHGRIQSSVTADVNEDRVLVTIHAAFIDLMAVGELDFDEVKATAAGERSGLLEPHLETMADRFRLLDGERQRLIPDSIHFSFPDPAAGRFAPGLDQRQATIFMEYSLSSPPDSLLFWQSFGAGWASELYPTGEFHYAHEHHNPDRLSASIPIYTALTVRRNGELVLLPSELGPGFPVRLTFTWEEEPIPLAHRDSLADATCGWENRPPNARLRVGENEINWTVFLTLEGLLESFPELNQMSVTQGFGEAGESPLHDFLSEHIWLAVDGNRHEPDTASLSVHPMSAMAVLHNRTLAPRVDQPGTVIVEISKSISERPGEVEAGWSLYCSRSMSRLYSEIIATDEVAGFSILNRDAPAVRWSGNPD